MKKHEAISLIVTSLLEDESYLEMVAEWGTDRAGELWEEDDFEQAYQLRKAVAVITEETEETEEEKAEVEEALPHQCK